MAEVNRETVTTVNNINPGVPPTPAQSRVVNQSTTTSVKSSYTTQNLVYFIFGVLEFLLVFRVVFKLAGANPASGFVSFIYGITQPFVWPFMGIFPTAVAQGTQITSVLEPSSLVAIAVYALLSWGIVKLIAIVSNEPQV